MAHKKFIENPLGVRLSKKESLLIPLQEQEERIPACFLSDLYGPRNRGYGGKDTSLPSRGLAPESLWGCHPGCFWVALFLRLAAKATWMVALRLHYPEASVVMQSPGSERPAKGKKANIVIFPLLMLTCSLLLNQPRSLVAPPALARRSASWSPRGPRGEVEGLEQIFPRRLQQSGLVTAPEAKNCSFLWSPRCLRQKGNNLLKECLSLFKYPCNFPLAAKENQNLEHS